MTIRELQESLKEILSGVESLIQGGCEIFCEDTREVYNYSDQCIQGGKVAVVVVTPNLERSGSGVPQEDGLPFEGELLVRCVERPPIAEAQGDVMRALDAAEIVSHTLDSETIEWRAIRQHVDERKGVFVATAHFDFSGLLTPPNPNPDSTPTPTPSTSP